MKKLLLVGMLAGLAGGMGEAQALTKPDDVVSVIVNRERENKPDLQYSKKWKELTLSAQTKAALGKKIQSIEQAESPENFRVFFLMIGDNEVQRVLFMGSMGSVVMMDWPEGLKWGEECSLSFLANGGFSGHGMACKGGLNDLRKLE